MTPVATTRHGWVAPGCLSSWCPGRGGLRARRTTARGTGGGRARRRLRGGDRRGRWRLPGPAGRLHEGQHPVGVHRAAREARHNQAGVEQTHQTQGVPDPAQAGPAPAARVHEDRRRLGYGGHHGGGAVSRQHHRGRVQHGRLHHRGCVQYRRLHHRGRVQYRRLLHRGCVHHPLRDRRRVQHDRLHEGRGIQHDRLYRRRRFRCAAAHAVEAAATAGGAIVGGSAGPGVAAGSAAVGRSTPHPPLAVSALVRGSAVMAGSLGVNNPRLPPGARRWDGHPSSPHEHPSRRERRLAEGEHHLRRWARLRRPGSPGSSKPAASRSNVPAALVPAVVPTGWSGVRPWAVGSK